MSARVRARAAGVANAPGFNQTPRVSHATTTVGGGVGERVEVGVLLGIGVGVAVSVDVCVGGMGLWVEEGVCVGARVICVGSRVIVGVAGTEHAVAMNSNEQSNRNQARRWVGIVVIIGIPPGASRGQNVWQRVRIIIHATCFKGVTNPVKIL